MKEAGLDDLYLDGTDGPAARARGIRARDEFYPKPELPEGEVSEITIPGPAGDIHARVIRPVHGKASATVVYFHGGGWVLGDLDSHHAHAVRIANAAEAIVVNVDYRLAPEHRFPAAAEDAFAAVRWAHDNIAILGGDADKLAVGGDSAGGNLAAAAALWARDNGIKIAVQFLAYPATDLSVGPINPPLKAYLSPDIEGNRRDLRASPALAETLAGVAPVILGVGPYDFLYEDNMAFAAKLRRDGVDILLRDYPSMNHGFLSFTSISDAARAAADELCNDLRQKLHGA